MIDLFSNKQSSLRGGIREEEWSAIFEDACKFSDGELAVFAAVCLICGLLLGLVVFSLFERFSRDRPDTYLYAQGFGFGCIVPIALSVLAGWLVILLFPTTADECGFTPDSFILPFIAFFLCLLGSFLAFSVRFFLSEKK